MNLSEIKKLLISSLDKDSEAEKVPALLEKEGLSYDFRPGFREKVLDRIFAVEPKIIREIEFTRYLNFAFSRIALTGVAAIVLLLITLFMMQGSLSFDSLLGLSDTYDESIVCLLTGN